MKLLVCLPALLWAATAPFASAGSATWSANATSSDWNTAANWTPATVPNGPSDVATFASSTVTELSLSKDTEISQLTFGPGSSAYTVTVDTPRLLTIDSPGIVNNSGETQSFAVYGGSRNPLEQSNSPAPRVLVKGPFLTSMAGPRRAPEVDF